MKPAEGTDIINEDCSIDFQQFGDPGVVPMLEELVELNVSLRGISATLGPLTGVSLVNADLEGAQFLMSELEDTEFSGSKLTDAFFGVQISIPLSSSVKIRTWRILSSWHRLSQKRTSLT